jgi:hypothetical protein
MRTIHGGFERAGKSRKTKPRIQQSKLEKGETSRGLISHVQQIVFAERAIVFRLAEKDGNPIPCSSMLPLTGTQGIRLGSLRKVPLVLRNWADAVWRVISDRDRGWRKASLR